MTLTMKPLNAQASVSGIWYKIGKFGFLMAYDPASDSWFRHESEMARRVITKGSQVHKDSCGRIFRHLTEQDKYDIYHSSKNNDELGRIYGKTSKAIWYVIKKFKLNNEVA